MNGEGQSPVVGMVPVITEDTGSDYRAQKPGSDDATQGDTFQRPGAPQYVPQDGSDLSPAGHFQETQERITTRLP